MMKNLTELVLDFNGIPWRRSALSSYEQHNATEITLNLGHHLPNLHRFKFIGTMPPPPSSIASLPSLASLSSLAHPSPSPTHSSSSSTMTSLAQFYLPTYSLPLSFLSNLPGNVAHVTLDVGYVPEFMWEEVSVRTRRLGRLRSLSVLVACEGGSLNGGRDGLLGVLERNGKGEVGGLERERVRWGTKELRERGVLYLGVSPSALVSSPSLLWHPQSPSPNPSENGGCEGEAEGEKTEMVDGAPSCRQFGCVVGGAGVERRRYLPLFLL
ncbi:hypothetical protein BDY19DRAFT_970295 [Irpex rosettiformis]|uniref:Uncharacterized protein n=1 Tax=Irpex rosettiformis TaxID=378272 RepID=A0ACB8TRE5_9APHY|nr:hypothetical protein BDY19DRAFT_970295 [Irpex rosettiformis]